MMVFLIVICVFLCIQTIFISDRLDKIERNLYEIIRRVKNEKDE